MSKIELQYYLDVRLVRLRQIVKRIFPIGLIVDFVKSRSRSSSNVLSLVDDAYPWSSPNIWREIISFYRGLDTPVVVEFGIGSSTINHLRIMTELGSSKYIGIEDNPDWFWLVVAAIFKMAHRDGLKATVNLVDQRRTDSLGDLDVEIALNETSVLLRLRPDLRKYLKAFNQTCDVVVVDGISRKECIQEILATPFLRAGGLLMLMEAGRGSDYWWEGKLYGADDYSSELETLISLGGVLLTGDGLDNWLGCKRKSSRPISYYYPMEACKLIMPEKKALTR